jgi:hypothetical protein
MRLDPDSLKLIFNTNDMLVVGDKIKALKLLTAKAENLENGIVGKALSQKATAQEFTNKIIESAKSGDYGVSASMDELIKRLGGSNSSAVNDIRNNILKDLFKKSLKVQEDTGPKMLQETLDTAAFANNVKALREDVNLSKFFTQDQFDALKVFEQYSRAIGGGLDSGGSIARGAETAKIVQGFQLVDAGLNIIKYDLAAWLLSRPQLSGMLKELRPGEGLSDFNFNLITSAIIAGQTELQETATGADKFQDEGIIDVAPAGDEVSQMQNNQSINVAPVNFNVNQASRLASVNPAGMLGTPTATTGTVDQNLLARGRDVFPNSITFAAKGGIMNTKKAFQRVI